MKTDTATDVAAILTPFPTPPSATFHPDDPGADAAVEGYEAARDAVADERARTEEQLRLAWEEGDQDPLLFALRTARRAKEQAEEEIRLLIAYGREFVQPRPYTLADLAGAAGMSVSGARTAYSHTDVDAVAESTGAKPRDWRAPDPAEPRDADPAAM